MNFFADFVNWLVIIAAVFFLIAIVASLLNLRARRKQDNSGSDAFLYNTIK